jgi:hypothetical protein
LNFIFGIVCLFVCVCAFSLRRESPDMILGDKPLIFEVVLSHGNTATVSEMGPMIAMGSTKAQGSKAKPVYGSEPPRATRARDEATQRMANILVHPVPH